ncbi:DUF1826 domain-containing protein [Novosphingobium sp. 9]|uniref:DUF1826 domain-containing protein n=1 Tax=Novosphingobium sp. 9 TaxID=2025349 RepID=UPI0021B57C2B|nr:DUF1826 domain-containing protein [Novosphingobium sp. 9]
MAQPARPRPVHLDWLYGLSFDTIDDLDFPVAVAGLKPEVAEGLIEAGCPLGEDTSRPDGKTVALARNFARIVGCARLKLRLEVVETDAGRKFHTDAMTARSISTLCGSVTDCIEATAPASTRSACF